MQKQNGTIRITQLWGADELYARHRIPGILVTSRGTVIVYNEARTEGSDWSLMDIFMQRSTDGGETFGEKIYLAEGTVRHKTVNNAVMTEGKDGTLHFVFCRNYSIAGEGVFYKYSRDDGLTWSPDREITGATLPDIRNAFAPGPGHGLCLPDGTIMMPVWMVLKSAGAPIDSHGPAVLGVLYSKDNGETWQTEGPITEFDGMTSASESEPVLLSDGRVMLTIRNGLPGFRGYAYSDDGIHFSMPTLDENVKDPCNFGAVASMETPDGKHVLLLVNSDWNENDDRIHMTLRASFDDGKTWSVKREFDADNGGYPDIAVGADGTIYILYEHAYGEKMFLVRTDLSWLMEGNR